MINYKLVKPHAHMLFWLPKEEAYARIEECGRVCYKSEANRTETSAVAFIERLIKAGHESVLEHISVTARFVCDRAVSHEIVRHRIASYSQESQRYVNYNNKGVEVIDLGDIFAGGVDYCAVEDAIASYNLAVNAGVPPQSARMVLPNIIKTELIMTTNLREWRHFFKLRTSQAAAPNMRFVALMLLKEFKAIYPEIFADIKGD